MAKSNRASIMPSKAEKGADFGFPVGAEVTIVEASWVTRQDMGEKAVAAAKQGSPDDPMLKLTGEIEGQDEPKTVHLGAGKASRLTPSRDGEFLEVAENSSATANTESSKSNIFLTSLCDKKQHGKKAYPEKQLDELPISEALVGLKFIAGSKTVEYNFKDDDSDGGKGGNKNKPALIADQIVELPASVGGEGAGPTKKSKKSVRDDDEDEEEAPRKKSKKPVDEDEDEDDEPEEKPAKSSKKKGGGDAEAMAEKAVLALLDTPKFRKGLPENKAYIATYTSIKDEDGAEDAMKFVEDEKWMQHKDRPWGYDEDDSIYTSIE